MIDLVNISIKDFKKELFKEYKNLFPAKERKPYFILKDQVKKNVCDILKIVNDSETVGFFILINVNNHILIDYFGIFEKFQSQKFGSKALEKLHEKYENSDGIFIEIEKLNEGKTKEDNIQRQRRFNFYDRLGYTPLNFDFIVFGVKFMPCSFNYKDIDNKEKSSKIMLDFYYATRKKKVIDKNCKVIL